jgi:hypothetical protein
MPEIVCFANDGPLTKRIGLDEDGKLVSDASGCLMVRGIAHRAPISCIGQLGAVIAAMRSNEALALGMLRHGLQRDVRIATKRSLNGSTTPNVIARTAQNITYRSEHGFVLLDHDCKGMPPSVAERLDRAGGFWPALLGVIPELEGIGHVVRASTSAGLYRRDTGNSVPGSSGQHVYLAAKNVADSARFLKTLHERCWLAGYGWLMVGAGGQLLERSIIDRMVGAPERLVFEGPPILVTPLCQDPTLRRPDVTEGEWLDTATVCPPLAIAEKSKVKELRDKAAHQLVGQSAKAREEFISRQAEALAERARMPVRAARDVIAKQCAGILLPTIVLPFDDEELAGKTVADVLADPLAFEGETLADPLEGPSYGTCKAMVMRRADGTPWIHSFAHGRTVYEIRLDAGAVRAAIAATKKDEVVSVLVELLLRADIGAAEEEALIVEASERSDISMRAIARQLKRARQARAAEEAEAARLRRIAERDDPRPMVPAPAPDSPWLVEVSTHNEVLGESEALVPPARNLGLETALARRIAVEGTHAFTSATANKEG